MPPVVLDARRFPPTIFENTDVALARRYAQQAQEAGGDVDDAKDEALYEITSAKTDAQAAIAADKAATALSKAQVDAALAALQLTATSHPDTAFAWQSLAGQLAIRVAASTGNTEIAKLFDMNGKDIFSALAATESTISALLAASALQPVPQRQRLKKALYYGRPRAPATVDPVTWGASTSATSISGGVRIARDDSRIRFLSGPWLNAIGTPGSDFRYPQVRTNGDPTAVSGVGVPTTRTAAYTSLEFVLPAGQTQFDMLWGNQATPSNFLIDIDGVGTNDVGYTTTYATSYIWHLVTLSASTADRTIRIITTFRAFGGLNLPAGNTIKRSSARVVSSMAFLGDSITAGSIASGPERTYAAILARRLGIDNYINLGVGGSGYLARAGIGNPVYTTAVVNTVAGDVNVPVVSGTLIAGHFISGPNIPRDATIVTGATAGGTAVISTAPSLTQSNVTVRDEYGWNFWDRIMDVLVCVDCSYANLTFANNSTNVTVVSGALVAGQFVDAVGFQKGTKVITGASVGGTAVISLPSIAVGTAVSARAGSPPDATVIAGGVNDRSVSGAQFFPLDQFQAQALRIFQFLRANAPDMVIFALGSWTNYNTADYNATLYDTSNALFAAAAQVPRITAIDVSKIASTANRDQIWNIAVDGIHPVDSGHQIYADGLYPQFAASIGSF